MTGFTVTIHRRARRDLASSPEWVRRRVAELVEVFSSDPFREDLYVASVLGEKGFFRVRVGDYRVVYAVDEEQRVVKILRVAPRGDAYYD